MRLAIITGASRGLGAALLARSAAHFDRVLALSRGPVVHDRTNALHIRCDLSKPDMELESRIRAHWPDDVTHCTYFSNAGVIGEIRRAGDLPIEALAEACATNLFAPARIAKLLLDLMRGGEEALTIVNISSGAAHRPVPGWSAYCASKAAARLYFECLAMEYPQVAVHSIDPGVMDTGMQAQIRNADSAAMPDRDAFRRLAEEGQLNDPGEVALRILDEVSA